MVKPFKLRVNYGDKYLELLTRIVIIGYHYEFHIMVCGHVLIFEYDEVTEFRVTNIKKGMMIADELISAIITSLEKLDVTCSAALS